MEDQKRKMEIPAQEIPPVKKTSHQEGRITVMFMRSVGRVRSFKISRHIVLLASVFFLSYFTVSIIVINSYFDLRHTNTTQSKMIERLVSDISKSKKVLLKSKQHIALLEDYIYNLEERQGQEGKPVKEENLQARDTATNVEQPPKSPIDKEKEKKQAKVVDIRDMDIQQEGSRINVKFKLVKMQPGANEVTGYIHMIATDRKSNSIQEWTYPKEELRNGIPTNFRMGRFFRIQRFKQIHGKFDLDPSSEPPSSIKVIIYDQYGVLLLELEKEIEGSNVS